MKTIEETIQEILAEHHECRWMDTSELESYLRKIVAEQKAIDDAERDTAVYNLLMLKLDAEKKLWLENACEWLKNVGGGKIELRCVDFDFLAQRLRKAMEE